MLITNSSTVINLYRCAWNPSICLWIFNKIGECLEYQICAYSTSQGIMKQQSQQPCSQQQQPAQQVQQTDKQQQLFNLVNVLIRSVPFDSEDGEQNLHRHTIKNTINYRMMMHGFAQ